MFGKCVLNLVDMSLKGGFLGHRYVYVIFEFYTKFDKWFTVTTTHTHTNLKSTYRLLDLLVIVFIVRPCYLGKHLCSEIHI